MANLPEAPSVGRKPSGPAEIKARSAQVAPPSVSMMKGSTPGRETDHLA
ncbi:MAG: hypothetical protein ACLGIE_15905 [Alphaproteobacteria bacterium]